MGRMARPGGSGGSSPGGGAIVKATNSISAANSYVCPFNVIEDDEGGFTSGGDASTFIIPFGITSVDLSFSIKVINQGVTGSIQVSINHYRAASLFNKYTCTQYSGGTNLSPPCSLSVQGLQVETGDEFEVEVVGQ